MVCPAAEDIFIGLSDVIIDFDHFDMGHGVTISRTYAHLMAPFLIAFTRAEPGNAHPAPWKPAEGGSHFDIEAELRIPAGLSIAGKSGTHLAASLLCLIRFGVTPSLAAPVVSNISFSKARDATTPSTFGLFEIEQRYIWFTPPEGPKLLRTDLERIRDHWRTALELMQKHPKFELMMVALDRAPLIPNLSLALLSIWGALESLFAPHNKGEIRFRVSTLIAAYLKPPGESRILMKKAVGKLYSARSAAAHGTPKEDREALQSSILLLRDVVGKILNAGHLPSDEDLERCLLSEAVPL